MSFFHNFFKMSVLYKIEDLSCAYNNSHVVLKIPKLEIEAGRTVVVLGKSGSGKSTFLETLALMNNTFMAGSILFSPPSLNGKPPINLSGIWINYTSDGLAKIRCDHFSFIFQQTNLMPNFTVFENIYVTKMMQGFPESECLASVKELLDRIGMSSVDANRKVTELSGGQRQRVAFARAIVSSFDVLFGDEPTGNLDEMNSLELLHLLKESLRNGKSGVEKTAIIVSHSISLAIEFADAIIVISKNDENEPGEIMENNVFHKLKEKEKTEWSNGAGRFNHNDFEEHLRQLF